MFSKRLNTFILNTNPLFLNRMFSAITPPAVGNGGGECEAPKMFPQLSPQLIPKDADLQNSDNELIWDLRSKDVTRKTTNNSKIYRFAQAHGHQAGEHYQNHGEYFKCMGNVGELHLLFTNLKTCWEEGEQEGVLKPKENIECKPSLFDAVVITFLLSFDATKELDSVFSDSLVQYFISKVKEEKDPTHKTKEFDNRIIASLAIFNKDTTVKKDGTKKYASFESITYKGSLTTPPFTENTEFFIVKQPLFVSKMIQERIVRVLDESDQEHEIIGCLKGEIVRDKPTGSKPPKVPLFEPPSKILVNNPNNLVENSKFYIELPN